MELDRKQQKPVTIIYPNQNLKLISEDFFSLAGISNKITVLCSEEKDGQYIKVIVLDLEIMMKSGTSKILIIYL